MNRKPHSWLLIILISAQISFGQTTQIEKKDELSPELRKEAVAFLREASADVANLRTLENRIGFSTELASLTWLSDEQEARRMYQTLISDFRQLIAGYDAQANAEVEDEPDDHTRIAPMMFGPGRNNASRKLVRALGVRQQLATSLAERDALLALDFFTSSGQAVTNPKLREQLRKSDAYFEGKLLNQIAEQNVDTALKYGILSLEKGFNHETLSLLKKIYEKDADKGIAYGEAILKKVKSDSSHPMYWYALSILLNAGSENLEKVKDKAGRKPIFSDQTLREMADLLVREFLDGNNEESHGGEASYIPLIEKFSPAGAAQLRQKFDVKTQAMPGLKVVTPTRIGSSGAPPAPPSPQGAQVESEQDRQKQLMESMQSLGAKTLSKEEREKTVAQARKTIAAMRDPNRKLIAFSLLASQIAAHGDKESGVQIMDEAGGSINLQPRNVAEFMQVWMLSTGYAQIDAQKSFPILEDAIMRLNETLAAFIKVGEFMDVGGEIIEDGEVQVGAFGGAMTRDLLGTLGAADATVLALVKTDFARTRDLTNKFERPEARILAKMIVLRALFVSSKKKQVGELENQVPGRENF